MRALLIFLAAVVVIILGLWATLILYFDEERLKQIATEQVREQTGRELTIDGELSLDVFPGISIVARDVQLSGPPDYTGPELFTADSFRMSVALLPLISGNVETGDIALEQAQVNLHTDAGGTSSLAGLTGSEPAEAPTGEPPAISTEQISLRNIRLVVTDAATDSRQVFVVDTLNVDSFRYGEPTAFEFQGSLGDPPVISDIDLQGEVTVPYGPGPVQISRLELEADLAGVDMALSGSAEVRPGPPLRASFSDGRLELGEDRFTTAFSFIDGERPKIEASLEGAMLDLDALMPAASPAGDDSDSAPTKGGGEAAESPLLLLRDVDLDARLALEAMRASGLTLKSVDARVVAENGIVVVDPLDAELDGGRIDATANIDLNAEPPRVTLSPSFDLESLARALEPWGLGRFLTGSGSLALELDGRGLDPASLLRSLNGSGDYDFRDGSIKGLNLDGMVEGLAARNIPQAVRSGVGGETEFESLVGTLQVSEGTIRLPGLQLIGEAIGITGDVRLGLADLALDGQIRFDRDRLSNVPIALEGTLTQPRLVPDVGEALKDEAGRRVMDFLQERARGEEEPAESDDGGGR
ncbi:MAG: AsmA family protein [Candidatus Wenzhouxiangella sp. M2_3B_020]